VVQHDRTVGGETNIEFDAIRAVGDSQFESLDCVVTGVSRRSSMAEDDRSTEFF
jgi:hypothetical protein